MGLGNRAGPAEQSVSEPETDINLEVSFSDQALSYKEGSKGTSEALTDADDKLPVSTLLNINTAKQID